MILYPRSCLKLRTTFKYLNSIKEFRSNVQKLACLRYTDEQMEQLMFHSRKMNEYYSDDNRNRAIFHDLECHKTICEMSGNLMFVRATEIIYQRLEQCFFQICATFDYKESIVFHERLIAALKRSKSYILFICHGGSPMGYISEIFGYQQELAQISLNNKNTGIPESFTLL